MKYKFIKVSGDNAELITKYEAPKEGEFIIRVEFGDDGKPYNAALPPNKDQVFEPMFTLRANDLLAKAVVDLWIEMAKAQGVSNNKIISAQSVSMAMANWPTKHKPD